MLLSIGLSDIIRSQNRLSRMKRSLKEGGSQKKLKYFADVMVLTLSGNSASNTCPHLGSSLAAAVNVFPHATRKP